MKSGSNLEKVLASGKPAVTAELGPPMSADGHEVVKKAHAAEGLLRRGEHHRLPDRGRPHLEHRRGCDRAARRARAGHADDLPRPQPDRDAGRPARRRGARPQELPLHRRRPPEVQHGRQAQGPSRAPRTSTTWTPASWSASSRRCATRGCRRAATSCEVAPKFFIGASWTPMGDPDRLPADQPQEEGGRRGGLHPDPGHLRRGALPVADGEGHGTSGLHERTAILAGIIVPKSAMMLKYMDASVAGDYGAARS